MKDGSLMLIKGVIFDLDGTLLDSMGVWDNLGERYLLKNSIIPKKNLNKILRTMSQEAAARYFIDEYGLEKSVEDIAGENIEIIEDFYKNEVQLRGNVKKTLERLSSNGISMCVATASDRNLAEIALKRNDIRKYFGEIFTCTEVGYGKDNPEIFLRALKFLGTPKEYTYIVEDALHAIETAKSAGFNVIAVEESHEAENKEKIKNLADIYIKSFEEIGDYID